ncbi:hypothetical protein DFR52_102249 [Hoeflea marina]|uniref:Uncharacterized protein n=1 Tax=Hoeflea marina TaxID=274592 RepID=A0A317PLG7_9HYPH|nr:hypothetical protein [Hoeflea marina]PWW01586.1 hypothetical protein DFR52_102249 [Hoeflea marina]
MTSILTGNAYPSTSPARIGADRSDLGGRDVIEEFSKWAHMSKAEQIRARYLEQHDMSEADLKEMSESERESVEDEIAQLVLRAYKMPSQDAAPSGQSGMLLNLRLSSMALESD